jgi:hypothetical protein
MGGKATYESLHNWSRATNIVRVISSRGKQAGYMAVNSSKNVTGKTEGTIV